MTPRVERDSLSWTKRMGRTFSSNSRWENDSKKIAARVFEHTGFEDDDSSSEVEMTFIVGETGAGRTTMCGSANYGAAMTLAP